MKIIDKKNKRKWKKLRSRRKKIIGTNKHPRLCVNRTNRYFSFQIINDLSGKTLYWNSTFNVKKEKVSGFKAIEIMIKKFKEDFIVLKNKEKIERCILDVNGFVFKGNIRSFALLMKKDNIIF